MLTKTLISTLDWNRGPLQICGLIPTYQNIIFFSWFRWKQKSMLIIFSGDNKEGRKQIIRRWSQDLIWQWGPTFLGYYEGNQMYTYAFKLNNSQHKFMEEEKILDMS